MFLKKARILRSLADSDFHMAKHFSLSQCRTTIVDAQGREQHLEGIFASGLEMNLPSILETICSDLEAAFEPQPIVVSQGVETYKMKIPRNPYYVLTFLFEDDAGVLIPKV